MGLEGLCLAAMGLSHGSPATSQGTASFLPGTREGKLEGTSLSGKPPCTVLGSRHTHTPCHMLTFFPQTSSRRS